MKRVICLLLLLCPMASYAVGQDKVLHFGLAGTAQAACTGLVNAAIDDTTVSNLSCFVAVNTIGIGKELADPYRGEKRELKDIGANLMGSGLVGIMIEVGF